MKTALITGGSSGLGFEFAKVFAKQGYHLVLVARDKEKLLFAQEQLLKITNVLIIQEDLSKENASERLITKIQNKKISIDVLVNNAGFATHGFFPDISLTEEIQELQVNIVTLTSLSKLVVKDMIDRKHGIIINISSTAAFFPGPYMAVYYASKAYVLSFSQALSREVKGTGVTVTVLCPGPTHTGFAKRADMERTILFKKNVMDAADVAQKGYEGAIRGKRVVILGFRNRVGLYMVKFIPQFVLLILISRMQK